MTFDLGKIIASKRAMRRKLSAMPIGDKLRMLDVLRERTLALRAAKLMNPPPASGGEIQGEEKGP